MLFEMHHKLRNPLPENMIPKRLEDGDSKVSCEGGIPRVRMKCIDVKIFRGRKLDYLLILSAASVLVSGVNPRVWETCSSCNKNGYKTKLIISSLLWCFEKKVKYTGWKNPTSSSASKKPCIISDWVGFVWERKGGVGFSLDIKRLKRRNEKSVYFCLITVRELDWTNSMCSYLRKYWHKKGIKNIFVRRYGRLAPGLAELTWPLTTSGWNPDNY